MWPSLRTEEFLCQLDILSAQNFEGTCGHNEIPIPSSGSLSDQRNLESFLLGSLWLTVHTNFLSVCANIVGQALCEQNNANANHVSDR